MKLAKKQCLFWRGNNVCTLGKGRRPHLSTDKVFWEGSCLLHNDLLVRSLQLAKKILGGSAHLPHTIFQVARHQFLGRAYQITDVIISSSCLRIFSWKWSAARKMRLGWFYVRWHGAFYEVVDLFGTLVGGELPSSLPDAIRDLSQHQGLLGRMEYTAMLLFGML